MAAQPSKPKLNILVRTVSLRNYKGELNVLKISIT